VYETDRFGGGKVMVWAGIYHDGSSQPKIVHVLVKILIFRMANCLLLLTAQLMTAGYLNA
jgi:hypothetical protein